MTQSSPAIHLLPSSKDKVDRMAPLAVLPVFLDLRGKRVIAIGGSEALCWKIELLVAAGALVDVLSPPDERCRDIDALAGQVNLIDRVWMEADLPSAALAVADIEDGDAQAFVDAARACGVPYNVIDKPGFCQVQFGAIVNRSPMVVSISTAGAAPILAQAARRRIETLLPAPLVPGPRWLWQSGPR